MSALGNEGQRPHAVVTGASSGIGLELARLAAADGHDLTVVARRGEKLTELADELTARYGVDVRTVVADLADPAGVDAVLGELDDSRVDVLVNNAGVGGQGTFAIERALADDVAMVELNVVAVVRLTGALLPAMVARGSGGILTVASAAGFMPGPLQAVYYASKAFVRSFSEALTEECRRTGVRVTALCPGPVDTEFAAAAGLEGTALMSVGAIRLSAAQVAEAGWQGLRRGRAVVVPGLPMRVAMQGLRITPRRVAARLAERSQSR